MRKRRMKQRLFVCACGLCALVTASLLVFIIGFIFLNGWHALNWDFLVTEEFSPKGSYLGIANAIVGTLVLSLCSVVIATPLSLAVAIYMAEYARENILTKTLRFLIDLLSGVPAIIIGVVGFIVFVWYFKLLTGGFSLISGSAALAILIFPTIERSAEEALKRTPREIKEASYALGCTKWDVIKTIVIPYALPGIFSGIILGIGRSAEESSVIILTAGYSQFIPALDFIQKEGAFLNTKIEPFQTGVGSLPISIYDSYLHPGLIPIDRVFATAIVLIFLVLSLNIAAKIISRKYSLSKGQ